LRPLAKSFCSSRVIATRKSNCDLFHTKTLVVCILLFHEHVSRRVDKRAVR
jgi:hypothetical protein